MRSQTPGQTAGARPLPQPGGGAAPGTQPLPTPPRAAEPGTRGSLSLGLPSSRQGLGDLALRPRAPHPGKGNAPGRRTAGSRRLFHPRIAASAGSCVLFKPAPHHQQLPPTSLPCSATSQTDRQETQRKKGGGGKPNYSPSCSHPPARSREEEEGEDVFPPPLHPDSATRADLAARSPGVAEREEVRLEEADTRRQ